jgi:hypothetical protein
MNGKAMRKGRPVLFLILMFVVSITLSGCDAAKGLRMIIEGVKLIGISLFGGSSTSEKTSPEEETDQNKDSTITEEVDEDIEDPPEETDDDRQNTPPQETTTENL